RSDWSPRPHRRCPPDGSRSRRPGVRRGRSRTGSTTGEWFRRGRGGSRGLPSQSRVLVGLEMVAGEGHDHVVAIVVPGHGLMRECFGAVGQLLAGGDGAAFLQAVVAYAERV